MKLILFLRCLHIHHPTGSLQLCVHVAYPGWLKKSPDGSMTQKRMANNLTTALPGRIQGSFVLHFMSLIAAIESRASAGRETTILHVIGYICLWPRDCVSLFSRLAILDEEVSELKTLCTNYFRANAVFFYVNPTVWTIGHLLPHYTQHMKGLALVTTQWKGKRLNMCLFPNIAETRCFILDGNRSFYILFTFSCVVKSAELQLL